MQSIQHHCLKKTEGVHHKKNETIQQKEILTTGSAATAETKESEPTNPSSSSLSIEEKAKGSNKQSANPPALPAPTQDTKHISPDSEISADEESGKEPDGDGNNNKELDIPSSQLCS